MAKRDEEMALDDTVKFKIGQMSSDITHVKDAVDKVVVKLDDVNDHVNQLNGTTIKAAECMATHKELQGTLTTFTDELRKKKTRDDNPAVAVKKSLWVRLRENIVTAAAFITAVSILLFAWFYVAHATVNLDDTLKITGKKQEKAFKHLEKKVAEPKYIYVQMPVFVAPDAGLKKKKKWKRR